MGYYLAIDHTEMLALAGIPCRKYRTHECNVIVPEYTDTDIFTTLDEKGKAAMAQTIPMKRLGNPVEIAYPILFFASDESSYCSGRVLDANGAWGL